MCRSTGGFGRNVFAAGSTPIAATLVAADGHLRLLGPARAQ